MGREAISWADKWTKKIQYLHTMEYFSTLNQKETQLYVAIWENLGDVLLREISQSQKGKYSLILPPKIVI